MLQGSGESRYNDIHNLTNCIGPTLLYRLLTPILCKNASISPTGTVRVLWAGSIALYVSTPKPGGMQLEESGRPTDQDVLLSYGQTKTGNVFLSRVYAKDTPKTGIIHAAFNPGNLLSELQRHW